MSRIFSSNRTACFLVPHALWERQSHRRTRKLSSHSRNKNIYVALILVTQRDPRSRKKLLAGHLNFKFTSFVALYGGNAATVAGRHINLLMALKNSLVAIAFCIGCISNGYKLNFTHHAVFVFVTV